MCFYVFWCLLVLFLVFWLYCIITVTPFKRRRQKAGHFYPAKGSRTSRNKNAVFSPKSESTANFFSSSPRGKSSGSHAFKDAAHESALIILACTFIFQRSNSAKKSEGSRSSLYRSTKPVSVLKLLTIFICTYRTFCDTVSVLLQGNLN